MGEKTVIAWTDHTYNPWMGCTKVSPGCDNCYAEAMMDKRYGRVRWGSGNPRVRTSKHNRNEPKRWNRAALKSGKRALVFCASLADWLDNEVDPAWREELLATIAETPALIWLLLSKRIGNIDAMVPVSRLPSNVALGASFVNQNEYDRDRMKLHAAKLKYSPLFTFGSFEPLLGHVVPDKFAPDWLIVGGESGGNARPCWVPDVLRIVQWSVTVGRAVFVKQLGSNCQDRNDAGFDGEDDYEWPNGTADKVEENPDGYLDECQGAAVRIRLKDRAGADPSEWPEHLRIRQFPRLP